MRYTNVWFQVDLQNCTLKLESWGHTNDELTLQWKTDDIIIKERNETINQHDFEVEFASNVEGSYAHINGKKSNKYIGD